MSFTATKYGTTPKVEYCIWAYMLRPSSFEFYFSADAIFRPILLLMLYRSNI